MKRETLRLILAMIAIAILSILWLSGCARQQAPPAEAPQAPQVTAAPADQAAEEKAIRQALHRYMENNGGTEGVDVNLAQVAITSDYALVTWTHGEKGGQAVLHREGFGWKVMDCGPGWKGLRGVCGDNVPEETAKKLLDQIDPNWPTYETF